MKLSIAALALVVLAAGGCGPTPNSGTLRDAFFSQIAALHGINEFEIKKNTISFKFLGDDYTATVTATEVEGTDDQRYTHLGSVDAEFTVNGDQLDSFEHLRSVGVDPQAIVAAWDAEKKRWRFDLSFEAGGD
jgi:hypothetical protein